jgi:predicted phage-related endonuclease
MTRRPKRAHRLKVVRIPITSREQWLELRKQDVTASAVGALFGLHPYETPAGLWAAKIGGVQLPQDEKTLRRGRIFEDAVAKAFLEERPGWRIKKATVYLRAPEIRIGATPDFFLTTPEGERGILQAKTVAPFVFKRHWTDTTVPTWIALQTLTEMMLARVNIGMIGALVIDSYDPQLHLYNVPRHEAAERRLQDSVIRFWDDVANGREPQIDYARDGALLAVIWPKAEPGKTIDLRGDNELPALLAKRERRREYVRKACAHIEAIETNLKSKMQDAEAAMIADNWRATLKETQRKEFTVRATSYRTLRIVKDEEAQND